MRPALCHLMMMQAGFEADIIPRKRHDVDQDNGCDDHHDGCALPLEKFGRTVDVVAPIGERPQQQYVQANHRRVCSIGIHIWGHAAADISSARFFSPIQTARAIQLVYALFSMNRLGRIMMLEYGECCVLFSRSIGSGNRPIYRQPICNLLLTFSSFPS